MSAKRKTDGLRAAKDFFSDIVNSEEYRNKLKARLLAGDLDSAREIRVWDYVWGKPVESIELSRDVDDLAHLTTDELSGMLKDLERQVSLLAEAGATTH